MRWEQTFNTEDKEVYELRNDDLSLLTLTYHPVSGAARIESANEKRTFVMRKEGFLKNKTVLRNEYGVRIGELGFENNETFIEMGNEKFFYTILGTSPVELRIYKDSKITPLVICKLNTASTGKESILLKSKKLFEGFNYASLLMSLCWYMFPPVAKKQIAEYSL